MVFEGQLMPNGMILNFVIANTNEKKNSYSPLPKVSAFLAQAQAGDLIDIVCIAPKNANDLIQIKSLEPYKAKPGENDPNGYVFVESFTHKTGDKTFNLVTVSKYLQKTTLNIPTHPDANGDAVPDDVLLGIADKLKAGQSVYAAYTGTGDDATLALLAPWANHFTGKFVRLDPSATVDSNGDTGPAVELTDAKGKKVTALIPGTVIGKKWVANSTVLEKARPLKADADVDFITAASGDKRIWLVNIQPAKPSTKSQMSDSTP